MPKSIHRPEYDQLRRLIRETRINAGVTQEALSAQLRRSQSFVSDIERGVRRIDIIELRDLCILLGIDWMKFLCELERRVGVPEKLTRKSATLRNRSQTPPK